MALTETTEARMRETVEAVAAHVFKRKRNGFTARRYPGRLKSTINEVERVMTPTVIKSDDRERAFYEELYVGYGGDPADLPWAKGD